MEVLYRGILPGGQRSMGGGDVTVGALHGEPLWDSLQLALFLGKHSLGSRLGKKKIIRKEAMSGHALRREASPDPKSPQPPARPPLFSLRPALPDGG